MRKIRNLDSDWLKQARLALEKTMSDGRGRGVERILYCLCRAKARPQRIGTSMKELRDIANRHDVLAAKSSLACAREHFCPGQQHYEARRHSVYYVKSYLARAGLKPESIGTSREELEQLNGRYPEDS